MNSSPVLLGRDEQSADQDGERRDGLSEGRRAVRDGYAVQTNIVRTNGTRGALLTIIRNGQGSTLT